MSRAPNGLAHILREDNETHEPESPACVELDIRNCRLATWKENGRYYQIYDRRVAMFPCDHTEHERQDMLHWCFHGILLRQLHPDQMVPLNVLADVIAPCVPRRVLDVGCGTGIWAMDIAQRYPNSWVEGIDIVGAQPQTLPNVRWRTPLGRQPSMPDFDRQHWPDIPQNAYDLLHASQLCGSITNWHHFARNCYSSISPGGWFESMEIDFEPRCDDGTLPPGAPLHVWWQNMLKATWEKPLQYPHHLPEILARNGFGQIHRITIPLPISRWTSLIDDKDAKTWAEGIMSQLPAYPCGQLFLPPANWTNRVKDAGKYIEMLLSNGDESEYTQTFNGLTMGPFTRVLHWRKDQVDKLVKDLDDCAANRSYHTYFQLHIVIARKPAG